MNGDTVNPIIVLTIIFGTGIVIAVSIAWLEHRTRVKALDVLRSYAQRGEEPPGSIVEAVAAVSSGQRPGAGVRSGPAPIPTRAEQIGVFAAMVVAALGSAGIAWWRILHEGEPGALATLAMFATVFFSMASAARLASLFYAPKPVLEINMSHVAANAVGVLGALAIAWWRMPKDGEPGQVVIWALIAAIFLAAMLAWSLVRVFTASSGGESRDGR